MSQLSASDASGGNHWKATFKNEGSVAATSIRISATLDGIFAGPSSPPGCPRGRLTEERKGNERVRTRDWNVSCADPGETSSAFLDLTLECKDCFSPAPRLLEWGYGNGVLGSGDVDCNEETNSIDAALILQFEAELLDDVTCDLGADVDTDIAITAIDSQLVLQFSAGLVPQLPV